MTLLKGGISSGLNLSRQFRKAAQPAAELRRHHAVRRRSQLASSRNATG